jgi:hypothetical protein
MEKPRYQWVLWVKIAGKLPDLFHLQPLERLGRNDGRSSEGEIQINDGEKGHTDHPGQEHGHHGLSLEIMRPEEKRKPDRRRGSH